MRILLAIIVLWALPLAFFQSSFENYRGPPFYFAPPNQIKHFSLGFQEVLADILWMRLLQNIDFCSSQKGHPVYDGIKKYQCDKGWSYKMTDGITELAPKFLAPYEIAGSIMSVIMRDKQGAKKIYDKALKNFPNNWRLHFSASYHYLVELEDVDQAIPLLIKTAQLGGPFWLYYLAAKSHQKEGRLLMAQEILKSALKKPLPLEYKKVLKKRLKELEKNEPLAYPIKKDHSRSKSSSEGQNLHF